MDKAARNFSFVPWARKPSLLSGCSTRSSYGCSRHLFCISLLSGLRYVPVHPSKTVLFAQPTTGANDMVMIGWDAWRQTASLDQCRLAFLHLGRYSRLRFLHMPTIQDDVADFSRPWHHLPSRDLSCLDLSLPYMQYFHRHLSHLTPHSPPHQSATAQDAKVVSYQSFQLQHLNHRHCPDTGHSNAQSKYLPTRRTLPTSST